jgi:glycine cleavage system regulatory protein
MMTVLDDQEELAASISSSADNAITSSARRSLVELSSQVFPQTIYRPRLIPRNFNSFGRKNSSNNIGSKVQPDTEIQCDEQHLIVDFNGKCSSCALEAAANTTTTTTPNNNYYYFSPALIGQEDDEDEEYHLIINTNSSNDAYICNDPLDPITLQYWNDSSLLESFDLLGVIANDDQDLNTPTATRNNSSTDNASGTFNMVNMLLTSPLDAADQYRTKAARMWESYQYSAPNTASPGAAEKRTSSDSDTIEVTLEGQLVANAAQTNPTKQIPMAFLEKFEGKSSLIKNLVLMEQQREMRKFLDNHDALLTKFVSRGQELQNNAQQQRHATITAILEADENCANSNVRQEHRKIDNVAPLHVPSIFFDSDFSLADPITFNAVESLLNTSEGNNSSSTNASTSFHSFSDHATFPIHLYWDAVDESLREQVTCKSDDFFLENSNFRELEILVAQANGDISDLRQEFQCLMSSIDEEALVLLMAEQRLHLQQLYSVLEDVTSVLHSKQLVENMLLSRTVEADYVGAYNLASQVIAEIDMRPSISNCSFLMESNRFCRLTDLTVVADIRSQLCQYQTFSVENAANLIVEIFISWGFIDYETVTLTTRSIIKKLVSFLSDIKQLSLINQRYTFR